MSDGEPLTGEPLALDLVNTRPTGPDGHPADLIDTPRRLAAWLDLEADRLPADLTRTAPSADDLAAVRAVRGHIEATLRAVTEGNAPPPSALRALTEAQRLAPAFRELAWDGAVVTAAPRRTGPLGVRLAALLAESAADLLTDPGIGKVRQCEAEDCVLLFLSAHPRRRWCSAARCGNRARVARYYRRHKPNAVNS
ncbi:ABATE domain-containing protein [Streptomyces sp. NBC_01280]|uniref:CGNR zinc finger domain-containing protein n=1 Tax=Streptomyces sp. NBC_01280 TaxID=2903810 RepID=UPI002E37281B|nr:ABATE domain-containing protein [Streptomyces sp. NBC_01280]